MIDINKPLSTYSPPPPPFVRIDWVPIGSILCGLTLATLNCLSHMNSIQPNAAGGGFVSGGILGLVVGAFVGGIFNMWRKPK